MRILQRLWLRIPVIVRAILAGLTIGAAGTVPWAALVSANLKHWSSLPWAVPVTAAYLWLFWKYVRGTGWPRSTANVRRTLARANVVPEAAWGPALLAGVLGLVSALLLQGVLGRLVTLPRQQDIEPSRYPFLTVLAWVSMSAIVAGVVEETAFRGYMQRPIECRHGPVVAIFATGTMFGLVHFTHPEVALILMPFYLAVAATYGMLAYLTDSTLPSMLLHAGGNLFSAVDLLQRGRSEWQLSAESKPLIWQSGIDAQFIGVVVAFLAVTALTVGAYVSLARAMRAARSTHTQQISE